MSISELDIEEIVTTSGYQCHRKVLGKVCMAETYLVCLLDNDEGVHHDSFKGPLEISFSPFLKRR